MTIKSDRSVDVPKGLLNIVDRSVNDIFHGSVTLIVQDAYVIQIDKIEKIRIDKYGEVRVNATKQSGFSRKDFHAQLLESLAGICHGQIVVQIKDGVVVQIDRTDRHRYANVVRGAGEGI